METTSKRLNSPRPPMTPDELSRMIAEARASHRKDFKDLTDAELAEAAALANDMYANNEDTTSFLMVYEDLSRAFVALDRVKSTDVRSPFTMAPDTIKHVDDTQSLLGSTWATLEKVRRRGMIMKAAHRILICASVILRRTKR